MILKLTFFLSCKSYARKNVELYTHYRLKAWVSLFSLHHKLKRIVQDSHDMSPIWNADYNDRLGFELTILWWLYWINCQNLSWNNCLYIPIISGLHCILKSWKGRLQLMTICRIWPVSGWVVVLDSIQFWFFSSNFKVDYLIVTQVLDNIRWHTFYWCRWEFNIIQFTLKQLDWICFDMYLANELSLIQIL